MHTLLQHPSHSISSFCLLLWTIPKSFIKRLIQSLQRVSIKLALKSTLSEVINGGYLQALPQCLNLRVNSKVLLEEAQGSYTDPRMKNIKVNNEIEFKGSIPISCNINHTWTASLRNSNKITQEKEVHTILYVWDKGLVLNGEHPLNVLNELGINQAKLGLSNRSRIISSLIYALFSCIHHEQFKDAIFGLLFPATTQGGARNTKTFCRGADYSAKSVTTILLKLCEDGWIEKVKGFRGKGNSNGVTTIWLPLPKLRTLITKLCGDLDLESFRCKRANIELREPLEDDSIDRDEDFIKDASIRVAGIQSVLQSNVWSCVKLGVRTNINAVELELTRKYKLNFQSGGRLYCLAQNLPKDTRKTLTINGCQTIELDYKSLHPAMLYHKQGFEAPDDSYAILNTERGDVKQVLLTALNAKTRRGAKQSVVNTLEINHEEAERIMNACELFHKPIEKHFYRSSWRALQYLDSCITMDVLSDLAAQGIPALPIHDSYIVEVIHEGKLRETMSWAYKKHVGNFEPIIE